MPHCVWSTDLSLEVHLRVPVGVIEDDSVGRGQVDPQAPSSGGQHEYKLVTALTVVVVDVGLEGGKSCISR